MKTSRILLLCSLLTVHCSLSAQQYGWKDISANIPPIPGDTAPRILTDMYFINDNEGWITTLQNQNDSSFILHTTDGGQTFELQKTQYGCETIHMLNENVGYAGGYMGRVYRTTDGGENWIPIGSTGSTVLDITFPPVGDTGYLCSGTLYGSIFKITPSGLAQMDENIVEGFYSISFPVSSAYGKACGGSIIITYANAIWHGGNNSYPSGGYYAIFMVDTLNGWAVGDKIIHTSDGEIWEKQYDISEALTDIYFLNLQEGWAVGSNGYILHTLNGGENWDEEGVGLSSTFLHSVFFTSPVNGYIAGNENTLLKFAEVSAVGDHPGAQAEIVLYPNPTREKFQISSSKLQTNPKFQTQKIEVMDLYGKPVIRRKMEQGSWNREHDISFLPAGIYFIRIHLENQTIVKKIIKL